MVGSPLSRMTGELSTRDLLQKPGNKSVALGHQLLGSGTRGGHHRSNCRTEPSNGRQILRTCPVAIFLTAAVQQWFKNNALENQQGTGTLGSTKFIDRKSTRLNSSHVAISYAVF